MGQRASWSRSPLSFTMWTLFTVFTTVSVCKAIELVKLCPNGHFFSYDTASCEPCSTCPRNQIIRVPCTVDSDTVCGPFSEFYEFLQAPRHDLDNADWRLSDEEEDTEHKEQDTNRTQVAPYEKMTVPENEGDDLFPRKSDEKHHGHDSEDDSMFPANSKPPFIAISAISVEPIEGDTSDCKSHQQGPNVQSKNEEENQWKGLALALIIVLCIVCMFLIVLMLILCYLRSRHAHLKTSLYSAENGASTGDLTRTVGLSLRYVPVFTTAQHGADSSGSGRYTSAPFRGRHAANSYVALTADDAENGSGQGTCGSDYVYFKSPQNGNSPCHV